MLATGLDLVACHNDPMPGNFLVADGKPMKMVDFEFASNSSRSSTGSRISRCWPGCRSAERWPSSSGDCGRCVNQQLSTAWDFDYHKYGCGKLMRSRLKMADPRWAFCLKAL